MTRHHDMLRREDFLFVHGGNKYSPSDDVTINLDHVKSYKKLYPLHILHGNLTLNKRKILHVYNNGQVSEEISREEGPSTIVHFNVMNSHIWGEGVFWRVVERRN